VRAAEPRDTKYDNVYVLQRDENGKEVEVKLAKVRRSPVCNASAILTTDRAGIS
jgi:hypothetical protein